ncbi:MAG TPA: hypothetical protein ENK05_06490 [Gammaproteobacteria bacterium]|nr:hypothetical protein [Gammaproteobacteria bacterium]
MSTSLPFVSPLKGRGAVRNLMRSAERSIDDIEQQMVVLAQQFKAVFRQPPTLRLVRQRLASRENIRLLWRLTQAGWGRQRYITLRSTEGAQAIRRLPPAVRETVLRFEPKRAELNARMRMAMAQYRACRDYLDELAAVDAFRAGATSRASARQKETA